MKTSLKRKLENVAPSTIEVSDENPRGLSPEQITKSPDFRALVTSIKEHGVLEPLIVKRHQSLVDRYVLIDGERRWRASLSASLIKIPVLLAKDDTDGRILAYQVHMLRQNWSKAAETRAIKRIIADLKQSDPDISDSALSKGLAEITSHKSHEISDLMKLCKYKDETIEKAIGRELPMSYLVQIESSFMNQLRGKYPDIVDEYGEDQIREVLITKALDDLLVNTRFLMDKFRPVFQDSEHKIKIGSLLRDFLDTKSRSISDTLDKYKRLSGTSGSTKTKKKSSKRSTRKSTKKPEHSDKFDYKKINITKRNQTSIEDVRDKLETIAKQLTDQEYEYVKEAVFCLERHCLKAATLMIWSAGVSRILCFIESDYGDFRQASKNMHSKPTSVYRHFAGNFNLKATNVDEFQDRANDRQLLCYLFYKKIINKAVCRQLLNHYVTRCECAHPSDISLRPNAVIDIFDNVYESILTNTDLR